ncbi:MAG: hypothetical protein ACTSVZ_09020 [Promethearchaeota archaeon]
MVDIELEIPHLIYIFFTSIMWLLMTLWGRAQFLIVYNPLPDLGQLIINISFIVGAVGIVVGIGLILYTIFE